MERSGLIHELKLISLEIKEGRDHLELSRILVKLDSDNWKTLLELMMSTELSSLWLILCTYLKQQITKNWAQVTEGHISNLFESAERLWKTNLIHFPSHLSAFAELLGLVLGQFGIKMDFSRMRSISNFMKDLVGTEILLLRLMVLDHWIDFFYNDEVIFSSNEIIPPESEFGEISSQTGGRDLKPGGLRVLKNKHHNHALHFKLQKLDFIFSSIRDCLEFFVEHINIQGCLFYLTFRKKKGRAPHQAHLGLCL